MNEISIKNTLLNEEKFTESFLKDTPFILTHGEICNKKLIFIFIFLI